MMTGNLFIDLATVAGFVCVSFLAFFLLNAMMCGRRRAVAAGEIDVHLPIGETRKAGFLKKTFAFCIPQLTSEIAGIGKDLRRAGHYGASALEDYLATRNVFVILVLGAFVALAVVSPEAQMASVIGVAERDLAMTLLVVGVVLSALLYALPRLALRRQAKARVSRIERGLPDALDIVQMCLTGGLPLRDSLQHVAREIRHTHPDVAVEFDIIRRQSDAGTMAKALRNFADRIDAPDIKALASTVTQTERMGTEVAVAVAEFADRMRLQFRQRAEERASRASVLLLFPIILCLVPPLLIAIAGPPVLKLRNFITEANQPGGVLDLSGTEESLRPQQPNTAQPPPIQLPSINQ